MTTGYPLRVNAKAKVCMPGARVFTISRDGKLVETVHRFEEDANDISSYTGMPLMKEIPIGEQVIDYHGDILLYYVAESERCKEFVARFTHGRLEWLRPLEDYPEASRTILVEQGAR